MYADFLARNPQHKVMTSEILPNPLRLHISSLQVGTALVDGPLLLLFWLHLACGEQAFSSRGLTLG